VRAKAADGLTVEVVGGLCTAVGEDLQHICVRSCATPNIIELFGSLPTTAGDAAVMTMRAISGFSG
jgi:hypothetical protein